MSALPEPELWTNEEIAEFLLNNSLDEEDYRQNLGEVLALGVDPLTLDPAHLDRGESWQRAEMYPDLLPVRRSS
jgi:hypothetical protein